MVTDDDGEGLCEGVNVPVELGESVGLNDADDVVIPNAVVVGDCVDSDVPFDIAVVVSLIVGVGVAES